MSSLLIRLFPVLLQISSILSSLTVGPNDATVNLGESATFKCTTSSSADKLIWTKYGSGVPHTLLFNGNSNYNADPAKYNVSIDNADYTLTVLNVSISDAVPYSCQTLSLTDEIYANLVVVGSLTPSISPSDGLEIGDTAIFSCSVFYGAPASDDQNHPLSQEQTPRMNMYLGSDDVTSAAIVENYNLIGTSKQARSKVWTVNRTLEAEDDGKELQCTISCTPSYQGNVELELNVSNPTTNVYFSVNSSTYHDGDVITCSANGNPLPNVKWIPIIPANVDSNENLEGEEEAELHVSYIGSNKWNCSAVNSYTNRQGVVKYGQASQVVQFTVVEVSTKGPDSSAARRIGLGVGLGVGLGLLLIAVIILLWCLCFRKRKTNEKPALSSKPDPAAPIFSFNPNPSPTMLATPVYPEQVAQKPQPAVRGSPGVPDLGVRHLGGSGSNLHVNQSFEWNENQEHQPNFQFISGMSNPNDSGPNIYV